MKYLVTSSIVEKEVEFSNPLYGGPWLVLNLEVQMFWSLLKECEFYSYIEGLWQALFNKKTLLE